MNIALFTTLGRKIISNGVIKYSYCRRYYLEHCIESYHYAVTYHLQFRKDAMYSLRKLRLSLLGNRLKDLIQDWHKAMSVSHSLIFLILSFHNSKIMSVIFGVVICHGRTRKAKLVQIRTQILLMKFPQTHWFVWMRLFSGQIPQSVLHSILLTRIRGCLKMKVHGIKAEVYQQRKQILSITGRICLAI